MEMPAGVVGAEGGNDGGGGVRVVPDGADVCSRGGRSGGRGQGAEPRGGQCPGASRGRRRANSVHIRWTAVARDAYQQRQNQFGRGEGGGVT